jgi:hypothetical protein
VLQFQYVVQNGPRVMAPAYAVSEWQSAWTCTGVATSVLTTTLCHCAWVHAEIDLLFVKEVHGQGSWCLVLTLAVSMDASRCAATCAWMQTTMDDFLVSELWFVFGCPSDCNPAKSQS